MKAYATSTAEAGRVTAATEKAEAAAAKLKETEAELAKVKAHAADRMISPEQRAVFIAATQSGEKGKVLVHALENERETAAYTHQISEMLQAAGYEVRFKTSTVLTTTRDEPGVRIAIANAENKPTHALLLLEAFQRAKIGIIEGVVSSQYKPDEVTILVGSKPGIVTREQ